jgi:hypothetical protein
MFSLKSIISKRGSTSGYNLFLKEVKYEKNVFDDFLFDTDGFVHGCPNPNTHGDSNPDSATWYFDTNCDPIANAHAANCYITA